MTIALVIFRTMMNFLRNSFIETLMCDALGAFRRWVGYSLRMPPMYECRSKHPSSPSRLSAMFAKDRLCSCSDLRREPAQFTGPPLYQHDLRRPFRFDIVIPDHQKPLSVRRDVVVGGRQPRSAARTAHSVGI